jgi:16S rRNA (cytidine1402-2'-O)-methyltransferase
MPPDMPSSPSSRRAPIFTAFGLAAEGERLDPGLYLVATPIGNLKDITFRALATLAAADSILAEDTRVTRPLLTHYGITTPLTAFHEYSNLAVMERLIERLKQGQSLALVCDAGTPLVSDPGFELVAGAIREGIRVTPVPGPSAILTALVASGLATDRFFFEGFLPAKEGARRARLSELTRIPGTLIFYEAPHRLPDMLRDAADIFGPRAACLARELTKLFETLRRSSLTELARHYAEEGPPKGEIVVLIGEGREEDQPDLDSALHIALQEHSLKDAAALVATATHLPKRDVYARALELAREKIAREKIAREKIEGEKIEGEKPDKGNGTKEAREESPS